MKNLVFIFSFIFSSLVLNAQWNECFRETGPLSKNSVSLIVFQNQDTIFCAENNSSIQGIYYSTNGGESFKFLYHLPWSEWGAVQYLRFIDKDTVLIVTAKGIYKKIMDKTYSPETYLKFTEYDSTASNVGAPTYFLEGDSGIIISNNIFRTYDGGKNWFTPLPVKPSGTYAAAFVYIPDSKRMITYGGNVLRESNDNGNTWSELFRYTYTSLNTAKLFLQISFPTNDVGFGIVDGGSNYSYLAKTINGGKTWDTSLRNKYYTYTSIHFFDKDNGYAILYDDKSISKTTDGGKTWIPEYMFKSDNRSTDKLFYYNDSTFFLIHDGKIYKRSALSLKVIEKTEDEKWDVQLYPNPIIEKLTIKLPGQSDNAKLKVLITDVQGREVYSKTHYENEIVIDFSDMDSGLYILTLSSDNKTYRAKVIKTE